MSRAKAAVDTIRRSTEAPHTHLREKVRRSETVLGKDEGSRMKDEAGLEGDLENSSHLPSSLPIRPLTARQLTAINLLAMGKTVTATAKTLGIGVSTLHRWKALHPLFRVELGRRQHDLFDSMVGKLRQTMGKAVDELFTLMTNGQKSERREVMWAMLKLLRPQKYLVPDAPVTVEEALDEQIRARRAANGEVAEADITEDERLAAIPGEFRTDFDPTSLPSRECDRRSLDRGSGDEARTVADAPTDMRTSNEARTDEPARRTQEDAETDIRGQRASSDDGAEAGARERPATREGRLAHAPLPPTSSVNRMVDPRESQRGADAGSQTSAAGA